MSGCDVSKSRTTPWRVIDAGGVPAALAPIGASIVDRTSGWTAVSSQATTRSAVAKTAIRLNTETSREGSGAPRRVAGS